MLVINFKTYKQGDEVIKLAKVIRKINKNIILGLQPTDIYRVKKETNLQLYSQHIDPFEPGRYTGFILPEAIKAAGASGTFLNHSEHKLNFEIIRRSIQRCKKLNLKTIVFARDTNEAIKISKLKPTYIALEPPELIASNISVSEAKPDLIKKTIEKVNSDILVGAGIKTKKDVQIAMKFGAKGILVSSAITTSNNPIKVIKELI